MKDVLGLRFAACLAVAASVLPLLTCSAETVAFSEKQQQLMLESNAARARYGIRLSEESAALMVAAQQHAEHLAARGYGVYIDRFGRVLRLPDAHEGFGNGTSQSRATASGFTGSLWAAPNILGEVIACNESTPHDAIEGWRTSRVGHYKATMNPAYDVCGFGHDVNRLGQPIYVGLFGRKTTDATPPAAAVCSTGATACQVAANTQAPPTPRRGLRRVAARARPVAGAILRPVRRLGSRIFGGCG